LGIVTYEFAMSFNAEPATTANAAAPKDAADSVSTASSWVAVVGPARGDDPPVPSLESDDDDDDGMCDHKHGEVETGHDTGRASQRPPKSSEPDTPIPSTVTNGAQIKPSANTATPKPNVLENHALTAAENNPPDSVDTNQPGNADVIAAVCTDATIAGATITHNPDTKYPSAGDRGAGATNTHNTDTKYPFSNAHSMDTKYTWPKQASTSPLQLVSGPVHAESAATSSSSSPSSCSEVRTDNGARLDLGDSKTKTGGQLPLSSSTSFSEAGLEVICDAKTASSETGVDNAAGLEVSCDAKARSVVSTSVPDPVPPPLTTAWVGIGLPFRPTVDGARYGSFPRAGDGFMDDDVPAAMTEMYEHLKTVDDVHKHAHWIETQIISACGCAIVGDVVDDHYDVLRRFCPTLRRFYADPVLGVEWAQDTRSMAVYTYRTASQLRLTCVAKSMPEFWARLAMETEIFWFGDSDKLTLEEQNYLFLVSGGMPVVVGAHDPNPEFTQLKAIERVVPDKVRDNVWNNVVLRKFKVAHINYLRPFYKASSKPQIIPTTQTPLISTAIAATPISTAIAATPTTSATAANSANATTLPAIEPSALTAVPTRGVAGDRAPNDGGLLNQTSPAVNGAPSQTRTDAGRTKNPMRIGSTVVSDDDEDDWAFAGQFVIGGLLVAAIAILVLPHIFSTRK
jgi:hypothetical protein